MPASSSQTAAFIDKSTGLFFFHEPPVKSGTSTDFDRFAGEWLAWDRKALKFPQHAKASKLVRRSYRQGWNVAGLG